MADRAASGQFLDTIAVSRIRTMAPLDRILWPLAELIVLLCVRQMTEDGFLGHAIGSISWF
jgi:hypothetical protein